MFARIPKDKVRSDVFSVNALANASTDGVFSLVYPTSVKDFITQAQAREV